MYVTPCLDDIRTTILFSDGLLAVIPNELRGELFPEGSLKGLLCFEVPTDETGLILVHQPAGNSSRRYLSLE